MAEASNSWLKKTARPEIHRNWASSCLEKKKGEILDTTLLREMTSKQKRSGHIVGFDRDEEDLGSIAKMAMEGRFHHCRVFLVFDGVLGRGRNEEQ
ncbi:hypothetical protein AAC387_Pa09g0745 [Persea americana]